MAEFDAGADQVIAKCGTEDYPELSGAGLTVGLLTRVGANAEIRAGNGWRIVSLDTIVTGHEERSGLIGLSRGHPTEGVVTVVYSRAASIRT
jgi:hypothetical protein